MSSTPKARIELSVIVPLHDEEANVVLLYDALGAAVHDLGLEYELIFVDDGSHDRTFELSANLARRDARLRVVKLRGNYGQTPAMVAGIEQARGRVLVTMDGDLQNDPGDIGLLLAKLDEGYDIAVGWRYKRHDRWLTRKLPSRLANGLIGRVTGIPIKDNGCSLKAFRSHVIKSVPLYSDMHRFIPAMASITGARVAEVRVRHHPRRFGVSKYGLMRTYRVLIDLFVVKTVVSFAEKPLRWFAVLALPAFVVSIGAGIAAFYEAVFVSKYSFVLAGMSMLFGSAAVFALFSGIMGEMIYKTGNLKLNKLALVTARQPLVQGFERRKPRC